MRADKARNKEQIIQTAVSMITPWNFEAVSLDEIARESGVTRATVYNHFSSKLELIKEITMPSMDYITSELKAGLDEAEVTLHGLFAILFRTYELHHQGLELASCKGLNDDPDVLASYGEFIGYFWRYMERARPEGYPLGKEESGRLISRIYLPVLNHIHDEKNGISPGEDPRQVRLDRFSRILSGALGICG
ncbi:TetR/AcrR family transcriptional regulator [Salinispira pacifica]|uniref:HTH tetR-type domain-containing protein n=1 Tax=Salinispira pacifica TaxID=1307761 RepID=V5WEH7_9SPIO|nr:TetR/AcrR family transcriptional regulator [Salinispira pacifica]AHC14218.1 hypothetical protein L21SP2_0796 [Salinispira pacifica]